MVSGPSGAGKGTLIDRVVDRVDGLAVAVSATTRAPRRGEEDGREYWFMDDDAFEAAVDADEFLEHVAYAGRRYGTLWREIEDRRRDTAGVVLEIEVEGARAVRDRMPDAVLIFVEPPSLDVLADRLRARGTEDDEAIARRLEVARRELEARDEFDVVILNDDLERATAELERTIRSRLAAS